MIRNKFFCQCGNIVSEYQIEDDLNEISVSLTSHCHNYCSVCGVKVDKENFRKTLDSDIKRCINKKEEKEMLESLIKGVEDDK